MPRIEIVYGRDGSVKSEVIGHKGPGCTEKTAFLEKVFGEPEKVEHKDSYYEEATETETDHIVDGLPSGHCG